MKAKTIFGYILPLTLFAALFTGCVKDPYDGVVSHERSIEAVSLGGGLTQVGPAIINQDSSKVYVQVLILPNTDLSKVAPLIQASYKANLKPASGEEVNFAANNNRYTYTVISESGKTRDWTIELVPFVENLPGTYDVTNLVVFGGTGPEYGGGAVLKLTDKPWAWPATDGPAAELDNELTFTFVGVTPEGNTHGTVTNNAGADGLFADFTFVLDPRTDVNHFYRKIPKGEGKWERDYTNKTITFTFADGTSVTGKFEGAGTTDLGWGFSKTVTDQAFVFDLNGTDDWGKIYSDYDKFVKRPRKYWIEVKKL